MNHIKILFWNINRKKTPFEKVINDITQDVDILILAEAENIDDNLVSSKGKLTRIALGNSKFDEDELTPRVYSSERRFKMTHLTTVTSRRLIAYTLELPGYDPIIFCAIHFPSKLEYDNQTQKEISNVYISWINEIESLKKTKRTVICGDFNMNPFEQGMISPTGFNAVMSKDLVKRNKTRTFHYKSYDYFYNPMWAFMGDHLHGHPKLPGSYHYHTTTDVGITYWNVFDKVILRPEIADHLDLTSLKIELSIGGHTFVSPDFEINRATYSDHLPISFNLLF